MSFVPHRALVGLDAAFNTFSSRRGHADIEHVAWLRLLLATRLEVVEVVLR